MPAAYNGGNIDNLVIISSNVVFIQTGLENQQPLWLGICGGQ